MRVTPISQFRGRILQCPDCGLLCRTSALAAGTPTCPRCGAQPLLVHGTGKLFGTSGAD
jgi:uncharacterized paraquat-inducible protein A